MTLIRSTTFALALLMLGTPAISTAQERGSVKEAIGTGLLRTMYLATPLVHAADGISTLRVLALGGRELNPIVASHVNNRAMFTATKTGLVAAEILLGHQMAKRHKFRAILAMAAVNSGYALVAAHNFRVAESMQPRRSTLLP